MADGSSSLLKPVRLDLDPNSATAGREWKHWHRTFTNFIDDCGTKAPDQFKALVNCVSSRVYEFIEECADYNSAIDILNNIYDKTPNEMFSRHILATRRQQSGESLDTFLQELRRLSKNCSFKAVTADQYREELIRDSFINGLTSAFIRQRLLENKTLTLQAAYDMASSMDIAQRNAELYNEPSSSSTCAVNLSSMNGLSTSRSVEPSEDGESRTFSAAVPAKVGLPSKEKSCYFCGRMFHFRNVCPARGIHCRKCGKLGHFE